MAIDQAAIKGALEAYCNEVRQTRQDPGHHPESSLYTHFEAVIRDLAMALGHDIQVIQQYRQNEVGAPDFGVRTASGAVSFIEAKPPHSNIDHFTGHDRAQFERYMHLGNLIYTNYSDLHLYQNGGLIARAELVPSQCLDPQQSRVTAILVTHDVVPAIDLLQRFFAFEIPHIGSVEDLAHYLARAAWLVRDAVKEAMRTGPEDSALQQIYREFRDVLFYELEPSEFADAYAQTLAYGLLLARQATQARLTAQNIAAFVDSEHHRLLSATLRLLSQPQVVQMVGWTINNLIAVINQVSPLVLSVSATDGDPLLYFYEDFLGTYDPELRKKMGVYYTPRQVVNLQTRVISHLLVEDFGRRYGFADETVQTLDPAVGTGTYLISALNEGCERIEQAMGASNVPDAASAMGTRLHGFEILVGPYTVAHFRMASAIKERGGQPGERLPILLCDTLLPAQEEPEVPVHFGFMSGPLTEERLAADEVKNQVPIMVILGNPPYRRAKAEAGWVWDILLDIFRDPVRKEYSIDLKNLADLYVWFYRWAIWKLFEAESAPRQGVLSFISNSRWILGGAFGGMRQVFRQYFDRIYIIDLHGDNRAPLPAGVTEDQNVFDIQVGVAISICIADGSRGDQEAEVYYYGDTWGLREIKHRWLDQVAADLSNIPFELVEGMRTDPFFPNLREMFRKWPTIKDDVILHRRGFVGVQTKRNHLVISPTREGLQTKIRSFFAASVGAKRKLFHETGSRTISALMDSQYSAEKVVEYAFRPLDYQYLYDDARFLDRPRPTLRRVWGSGNIAFATLPAGHGSGPTVFLFSRLPDLDTYNGRSGYILPLWDNSQEAEAQVTFITEPQHNFNPTLLAGLQAIWKQELAPEDIFAYCYAVLSAPSYSLEFSRDLARSFPRVPFPRTLQTFQDGVKSGQRLARLHSFQERYPADGSLQIQGTPSQIEFAEYNQDEQRVDIATAAWVGPVSPEAWVYSVSGYELLRQWLLRRREVPFDLALRQELLDVIWIIERTVEMSAELDELLSRLLEGETLTREELGLSDSG